MRRLFVAAIAALAVLVPTGTAAASSSSSQREFANIGRILAR